MDRVVQWTVPGTIRDIVLTFRLPSDFRPRRRARAARRWPRRTRRLPWSPARDDLASRCRNEWQGARRAPRPRALAAGADRRRGRPPDSRDFSQANAVVIPSRQHRRRRAPPRRVRLEPHRHRSLDHPMNLRRPPPSISCSPRSSPALTLFHTTQSNRFPSPYHPDEPSKARAGARRRKQFPPSDAAPHDTQGLRALYRSTARAGGGHHRGTLGLGALYGGAGLLPRPHRERASAVPSRQPARGALLAIITSCSSSRITLKRTPRCCSGSAPSPRAPRYDRARPRSGRALALGAAPDSRSRANTSARSRCPSRRSCSAAARSLSPRPRVAPSRSRASSPSSCS